MAELDVRAGGAHAYDVAVTGDDGRIRRYHVTVPESLLTDLGMAQADEPTVLRRALELLVDREGHAMPQDFSLTEAERSYPGFTDQLRAALAPR